MLQTQGSMFGTWIHSTGGPIQDSPLTCTIQANKRVNSHGIEHTELIGTISPKDINKVNAAAKGVQPQHMLCRSSRSWKRKAYYSRELRHR